VPWWRDDAYYGPERWQVFPRRRARLSRPSSTRPLPHAMRAARAAALRVSGVQGTLALDGGGAVINQARCLWARLTLDQCGRAQLSPKEKLGQPPI
jgi:hypothetical protein